MPRWIVPGPRGPVSPVFGERITPDKFVGLEQRRPLPPSPAPYLYLTVKDPAPVIAEVITPDKFVIPEPRPAKPPCWCAPPPVYTPFQPAAAVVQPQVEVLCPARPVRWAQPPLATTPFVQVELIAIGQPDARPVWTIPPGAILNLSAGPIAPPAQIPTVDAWFVQAFPPIPLIRPRFTDSAAVPLQPSGGITVDMWQSPAPPVWLWQARNTVQFYTSASWTTPILPGLFLRLRTLMGVGQ